LENKKIGGGVGTGKGSQNGVERISVTEVLSGFEGITVGFAQTQLSKDRLRRRDRLIGVVLSRIKKGLDIIGSVFGNGARVLSQDLRSEEFRI